MPPDYDVMGYDEVMGDEDVMGAILSTLRNVASRASQLSPAHQIASRLGIPTPSSMLTRPGGPLGGNRSRSGMPFVRPPLPLSETRPDSKLRSACGAGVAVWGPTDGSDKVLTIEPQESFRGERLVIDFASVGGVAAGLVVVRRIEVGTMPQSPSVEQPMPAVMFRPDATYASLDLQIASKGTKLTVILGVTAAPGAGVTTTATAGYYGEWIR